MATRSDMKRLARLRLREAEALFDAKLYDGCVYLTGYVLELALKARVCKVLGVAEYPAGSDERSFFHTHNFDRLRLLGGLRFDLATVHPDLMTNWAIVAQWKPEWRYDPLGTQDQNSARGALNALRDVPYGVLTWISKRW
jgi:hypothetical protein